MCYAKNLRNAQVHHIFRIYDAAAVHSDDCEIFPYYIFTLICYKAAAQRRRHIRASIHVIKDICTHEHEHHRARITRG